MFADYGLEQAIGGGLKFKISNDKAGRLIGSRGVTIKTLRKRNPETIISVLEDEDIGPKRKRYVQISGKKLLIAYIDIVKTIK